MTIVAIVMVGWVAHIPALTHIVPTFVTMKFNTALCIALEAAALLIHRLPATRTTRGFSALAIAGVCAIAAVTLAEYVSGRNLGIDELFIRDPEQPPPAPRGRMAPNTAIALLAMGLCLALDWTRRHLAAIAFATVTLTVATIGLIGYLYGVRSLYTAGRSTAMAIHTTTTLLLLALSYLLANPDRGYMSTLLSEGVGGRMARRILPAAIATNVILGWLRIQGQKYNLYDTWFGVAILVLANMIILSCLILMTSRSTDRGELARLSAERARQRSDARYGQLFEEASDAILVLGSDLTCHEINAAGERLLQSNRDAVIGKKIGAIVDPADLGIGPARLEAEPILERRKLRRPDGTTVHVESSAKHMPDGRFMLIARDVTHLAELENQLLQAQKLDALGKLAGGVAHDFNNMLMVILNRSELVGRKLPATSPLRAFLSDIERAAKQSGKLTYQLLAAARKQVIQPEVIQPAAVVGGMLDLLGQTLGENITMRNSIAPDLWRVLADPAQLSQVLLNLAVNARDAMPEGGTLLVEARNFVADATYGRTHHQVTHGEYVVLIVSDTGCGIPPEIREKIFDPFFTTKEAGRGTGLGLSVVRGVVEQMGGRISVYSEVGHGTTFKIYFPRYHGDIEQLKPATEELRHQGSETVLLVEDSDLVRQVLVEALVDDGYKVLEAKEPTEALRFIAAHPAPIDMLVTDVIMPVMDGRKLADRLLAERPKTKVIFMSGYTDEAVTHRGIIDRGAHFLEKPVLASTLLRKVRDVLDEK